LFFKYRDKETNPALCPRRNVGVIRALFVVNGSLLRSISSLATDRWWTFDKFAQWSYNWNMSYMACL